jgi:hypothetical protein
MAKRVRLSKSERESFWRRGKSTFAAKPGNRLAALGPMIDLKATAAGKPTLFALQSIAFRDKWRTYVRHLGHTFESISSAARIIESGLRYIATRFIWLPNSYLARCVCPRRVKVTSPRP